MEVMGVKSHWLALGFGDPYTGRVINIAKVEGAAKDPVHAHRTDTLTLGTNPRQIRNIGVWMGPDDFLLTGGRVVAVGLA